MQGQPKLPGKGLLRKQKQLADKLAKAEARKQSTQTDRHVVSEEPDPRQLATLAYRRQLLAVQMMALMQRPPEKQARLTNSRHLPIRLCACVRPVVSNLAA